ncbi:MAG: hypothetical protein JST65_16600 [Acidobacteria bacterium]|nr:hypothetical protein [Acidobacteriota bacterium]
MNQNQKPFSCRMIGLNCRDCVAGSALQLAMVCGQIPNQDIERVFFAMYDDPACMDMSDEFANMYRACVNKAEFIPLPTDAALATAGLV